MSVQPWSGLKRRTCWMLYKPISKKYHPYCYGSEETAQKQKGWFGDEVHKMRIVRIKEKKR